MSTPTSKQIETARDVLLWLSENRTDGRLRDAIGEIRYELSEELDARERDEREAALAADLNATAREEGKR